MRFRVRKYIDNKIVLQYFEKEFILKNDCANCKSSLNFDRTDSHFMRNGFSASPSQKIGRCVSRPCNKCEHGKIEIEIVE